MRTERHDEANKYFSRRIGTQLGKKKVYLGTISWWSQKLSSTNVNIRDNLW